MRTNKTYRRYVATTALALCLFFVMLNVALAGTPVYNDFGIRRSENGICSTIDITLTGASGDAAAGGSLLSHTILHLGKVIDAQLQLVEVEVIPGTGTAEPSEANITVHDGSTIKWGPKAIDNSTADTSPGSVYGGHDLWGVFPVCDRQWYLTVADIGDANTVRIRLKFK